MPKSKTPGEWSAHEPVIHMADSEIMGATRARMVIAQPGTTLMSYDDDKWSKALDYPSQDMEVCLTVVGNNALDGVTWVHSYVMPDRKKTFCIYDAPSPEAILAAARRNNLPVDKITPVNALDPYSYQ
jgi:hypothetical protein